MCISTVFKKGIEMWKYTKLNIISKIQNLARQNTDIDYHKPVVHDFISIQNEKIPFKLELQENKLLTRSLFESTGLWT